MVPPASSLRAFVACATGALVVALPAVAAGVSVVYTDAANVWVASQDGAVKRQVTTNGSASVPWVAASQADSGKILAFLRAGSSSSMTYMNPDGSIITSGITPVATCDVAINGPFHSRLSADGTFAVYDYFCLRGVFYNWRTDPFTVVTSTARVSSIGSVTFDGWNPAFVPGTAGGGQVTDQVLNSTLGGSYLQRYTLISPPVVANVIQPNAGGYVWSADVSRDGSRLAGVEDPGDGTTGVFVYAFATRRDVASGFTSGCRVATGPNPSQPNWSPDGTRLAWSDDQGAKVASITYVAGSSASPPACGIGPVTVLSATGRQPVFSDAPAPGPAAPPGGGGASAGGGTVAPTLAMAAPGSISRAAIRSRGITVTTRCPAACRVQGTMRAGSRVIARGSVRLRRAGVARVTLRARVPSRTRSVTVSLTRAGATATKVVRVTG